jgi:hypothetical protein
MLLYDMISKKHLNISNKIDAVDIFIENFFEVFYHKQFSHESIISYIYSYIQKFDENDIDFIVSKYSNIETMASLKKIYFNSFNSIEMIKEEYAHIINLKDCQSIKRDMTILILYETISNVQIIY